MELAHCCDLWQLYIQNRCKCQSRQFKNGKRPF